MIPTPMSPRVQTRLASFTAPKTMAERIRTWRILIRRFSTLGENFFPRLQRYIMLDSE